MFTVQLGDEIVFQPCGDSKGSNVIYTNSKGVFEDCKSPSTISSEVVYIHIGDCVNTSWKLRLPVNAENISVGVFYLLSDYGLECKSFNQYEAAREWLLQTPAQQ